MLRHVIKISVVLAALVVCAGSASAKVVEQLIAVIDGEPYTLSEIAAYAKNKMGRLFPSGDLNQINVSDREVLEQFLTEKLLEVETREQGIKITDEGIDEYIEQVKKANHLSEDDFKTILSREGQTLASYRAAVKTEMEKSELINRQVRKKINITDDDVERYYKLNIKKYQTEERARFRHILLALPEGAPADQVQAVMAKARELYQRIMAGEDFARLAQEYSAGAGQASGGDIGWVRRGTLIEGLEEVAFKKLAVGEVSEPFRTAMGIHLVKLENYDRGRELPLKAVAPKIKEELQAKSLEERFERWLKTDLRRKHRVDVKIAGVVFKPEDTKENTVDSLIGRTAKTKQSERSFLSYLNPFSYLIKETPFEEDDPRSPLAGKSVVSVFGVPLFTTETVEEVPDVLSPPAESSGQSSSESGKSGGFFSSIIDSLNPFKR
jgi:peptidyl-prolyl cis-trans isomerase SurA